MKKNAAAIVLTASLLALAWPGGTQSLAVKPPTRQDVNAASPPPQPASAGRRNPFVPATATAPATSATSAPSLAPSPARPAALPTLAGVVVRGKTVLACFRTARTTIVVSPGDKFACDTGQVTFVSHQNEAALIEDTRGRQHRLRISLGGGSGAVRPSSPPRRSFLPAIYDPRVRSE